MLKVHGLRITGSKDRGVWPKEYLEHKTEESGLRSTASITPKGVACPIVSRGPPHSLPALKRGSEEGPTEAGRNSLQSHPPHRKPMLQFHTLRALLVFTLFFELEYNLFHEFVHSRIGRRTHKYPILLDFGVGVFIGASPPLALPDKQEREHCEFVYMVLLFC